ncbi:ROK family protein [Acidiferrimicrobium sp. IK]|uniref:ROK family transcriptional regulator n=1 Tax=Acidiferrimicrobium sp. IK TaxID=2871700 RepID=UPI0021CB6955|nr:ROK family transcriptional regulator [Acidiferrimicrobium sp. IK]MCU4184386.1 ROK family protein [Acidiferrimicrobium sp. IK]
MRRHNLAAVIGHVHRSGPTSRAELTQTLGLNRSTIGALVDELSARGLVAERSDRARRTPGRPSYLVTVRTDTVAVLAVVLGVDTVTVATVAPGGEILAEDHVALTTDEDRSFDRVLTTIARSCKKLAVALPHGTMVTGMGVAVPGIVRRQDGLVHFAPNLGWRDVPLGARLRTRMRSRMGLDVPVACRNDAGLGALAEHARGIGAGVANLVYLHAEVGVGGGIVVDGALLEGAAGYGGEVGHMRVNPDGAPCRCGSRGCWETEVGEDALVALAGRRPGGRAVVEEVLRAVVAGEPSATRAVNTVARWLGIGVANLINCFNPDMVVLGGLFADVMEHAGPSVIAQMRTGLVTPAHLDVALVTPTLGRHSVLLGAAEVALEPVLSDPACLPVQDIASLR